MYIYYRICEKEPTISFVERYNNFSKKTILRKSWESLKDQFNETDRIIFIHDEVCDQTLDWLDKSCPNLHEFVSVPEHDFSYHQHTVTLVEQLEKNIASSNEKDIHFLVEDDYLFSKDAMTILRSMEGLYGSFFVPYDYPDRYKINELCQVITGPYCHWRTINSCTMTIAAPAAKWKAIMPLLKMAAPSSNDKIFEQVFRNHPCVSPLPGVASHLTAHHATPYFNVDKRLKELD